MTQLKLPMLTLYEGPRLVDGEIVDACRSYRDAVLACWEWRHRKSMTRRKLAEEVGCRPSHLSEYLSTEPLATARDMPAKYIAAFEVACGNRMITQWLARQAQLTIMEQYMQQPLQRKTA